MVTAVIRIAFKSFASQENFEIYIVLLNFYVILVSWGLTLSAVPDSDGRCTCKRLGVVHVRERGVHRVVEWFPSFIDSIIPKPPMR